jgi:DNA polymerase-3 subunit alpha
MSKKKQSEILKERKHFVEGDPERGIAGAVANGVPAPIANEIYDEIVDFANYAFPKGHAVAYGVISYQTAYLKCYYPREYMAALLSSVLDSSSKISEYIAECRQNGISVLPPDINESGRASPSPLGHTLRPCGHKGHRRGFVRAAAAEREGGGPFRSFDDFCRRMYGGEMNKRALENLIKAGAFDSLGVYRSRLLQVFSQTLDNIAAEGAATLRASSIFSAKPRPIPRRPCRK